MKEFYRATEKAFLSLPENFRDWATIRVAEYYMQFGLSNGFRTKKAQTWGRKIMDYWYQGKLTPLSEFADGLFDGYKFNFYGLDSLQSVGGGVLVVNYPNTGPLRGSWFKFLINKVVAEVKKRQGNYEVRWVQGEDSVNPIFANTPIGIQRRRLSLMIHKSCQTIFIGAGNSNNKIKALLEMRKHLVNDGVLAICPEGKDNQVLTRGRQEAGSLLSTLVRKLGVTVRPVGAWNKDNTLNLNFGKPMNFNDLDCCESQKIADFTMCAIAKLLPQEKRGFYHKLTLIK